MNGGDDKKDKANILGARANGKSFLPVFATSGVAAADATAKPNGATGKENTTATMASGAHSRKPSASSLSDALSHSPDASRIPRPSSRASPQTRRPFTLDEATDWAKTRLAQGSPSPAPRPTRPGSVSSDHRPLPHMFSQRPIDLGRLGNRRPVNSARRDGTFSSKDSFGSSSRKGDESDSEIDRKLKQFEEDEKIIRSMKEDKKGLFIKPKFGANGAGTNTTPSRRTRNSSLGNSGADGKESRQSWGFAETGYANPDWIQRFKSEEQALDFAPGRQARIEGFSSFGSRVAGPKEKVTSQSLLRSEEKASAIPRPATVAPIQSPNKSYAWQVDEDFTAGDLQVSNSPPLSFGRANTKLDEIRKLEIDAELDHPVENHRFVAQRTNTKLDEILQREREAERKYPIPRIEEPSVEPVHVLPRSVENRRSFTSPKSTRPEGEFHGSQGIEAPTEEAPASTQLKETIEQRQDARSLSPRAERNVNGEQQHQTRPPVNPEFETRPYNHDYNGLDGEKIPDTPVTIYRKTSPTQPTNEQNGHNMGTTSSLVDPANGVSRAKEDSHDLLRRLARASSKSPSPSPAQEIAVDKAPQENKSALPVSGSKDKSVEELATNDTAAESNRSSGINKPNALAKPTVGFAGISRSPSTKSVSSTQSRASADPTARIEGEMKLFALLDNMSERGSVRAPSPRPDVESESEDEEQKADETPRPPKFDQFDPLSMPTPQVTGAYVETPVTVKTEQLDIKEVAATSAREPEKRAGLRNRDSSTSFRSSKSDGQRARVRSSSVPRPRRSRSTPRKRSPLTNSVKPPTVEEDLKQIHLSNNIDDSTLDDFADFIASSRDPDEVNQNLGRGLSDSEDTDGLPYDKQLKRMNHMSKALSTGLAGIRQAKQGIERLEDRVAQSEQAHESVKDQTSGHTAMSHHFHNSHDGACPQCDAIQHSSSTLAYVPLPVPRLYRTEPRVRPTWLGILVLLLTSWYFLENAFYERWGRQYVCYRGSPCNWSPDQPDYGYVLPVKLDEWLTGGMVRPHAAHWLDEASDLLADVEDWWTGTDIRNVDFRTISDYARREQHFRRIDKKGLRPKWKPRPEFRAAFEALEREALAMEEAEAYGETYRGPHGSPTEESMGKDDVLSRASDNQEPARTIWF
ncbi:hypothetical protein J7T55_008911 [Diaporthe amygdali]|uniref:uncharacterized protein n=1 Tax=Phomopsis amygdali TaxID=1214568 RepID=UPI0022FE8589|nr:uncharacterized protein J7T55_008911 [Diaporthe amygdali]KAJ0121744.1 hypothetical protein J7T55_008911 [Diaporthe amygdali]